jgi:hypothetical protein
MSIESVLKGLTGLQLAMLDSMVVTKRFRAELELTKPEEVAAAEGLYAQGMVWLTKDGDTLLARPTQHGIVLVNAFRYMTKVNPTKWKKLANIGTHVTGT